MAQIYVFFFKLKSVLKIHNYHVLASLLEIAMATNVSSFSSDDASRYWRREQIDKNAVLIKKTQPRNVQCHAHNLQKKSF